MLPNRHLVQAQVARVHGAQRDARVARERLRRSIRAAVSSPRGLAVGFGVGAAMGRSIALHEGSKWMTFRMLMPFLQLF